MRRKWPRLLRISAEQGVCVFRSMWSVVRGSSNYGMAMGLVYIRSWWVEVLCSIYFGMTVRRDVGNGAKGELSTRFFDGILTIKSGNNRTSVGFINCLFISGSFNSGCRCFCFPSERFVFHFFCIRYFVYYLFSYLVSVLTRLVSIFCREAFVLMSVRFKGAKWLELIIASYWCGYF